MSYKAATLPTTFEHVISNKITVISKVKFSEICQDIYILISSNFDKKIFFLII